MLLKNFSGDISIIISGSKKLKDWRKGQGEEPGILLGWKGNKDMYYSITELAQITGYTTRSLRSFQKQGLLKGKLIGGKWLFSDKEIESFLEQDFVREGRQSKLQALVSHFMYGHLPKASTLLVHDEKDFEKAEMLNKQVLELINGQMTEVEQYFYKYDQKEKCGRFLLEASAEVVAKTAQILGKLGQKE